VQFGYRTTARVASTLPPAAPAPVPAPAAAVEHVPPVSSAFRGPAGCPNCGHPLQFATLAGYRVAYCENCKYKNQTLAQGPRR
jgi:chromosome partitioning protein